MQIHESENETSVDLSGYTGVRAKMLFSFKAIAALVMAIIFLILSYATILRRNGHC